MVLIGSERERAQQTLDALGSQTAVDRIEAVILDTRPDLEPLRPPAGLRTRIERLPGCSLPQAKAKAARESAAPIIAYIEDHATPDSAWAEAVIAAFEQRPRGAVGYAFRNGNPRTWVSRAGFMSDYVTWAEPIGDRLPARLACNNVAYDRGLMIERSDRLETLISSDVVIQEELRAAGHELHTAADAIVYHENLEQFRDLFAANFHHTRLIAAKRVEARGMGAPERLAYAAGALVLVAPLKMLRDLRSVSRRPRLWGRYLEALPVAVAVHIVSSVGEAIGYLAIGDAERDFMRLEVDVERMSDREAA